MSSQRTNDHEPSKHIEGAQQIHRGCEASIVIRQISNQVRPNCTHQSVTTDLLVLNFFCSLKNTVLPGRNNLRNKTWKLGAPKPPHAPQAL